MKTPFAIYAAKELLLEKIPTRNTNVEEPFTTKEANKRRVDIHHFHTVSLIAPKAKTIFTEVLTACKSSVQILKSMQQK